MNSPSEVLNGEQIYSILHTDFEKDVSRHQKTLDILLQCLRAFPKELALQLIKFVKLNNEKGHKYDIPELQFTKFRQAEFNEWKIDIPRKILRKRDCSSDSNSSFSSKKSRISNDSGNYKKLSTFSDNDVNYAISDTSSGISSKPSSKSLPCLSKRASDTFQAPFIAKKKKSAQKSPLPLTKKIIDELRIVAVKEPVEAVKLSPQKETPPETSNSQTPKPSENNDSDSGNSVEIVGVLPKQFESKTYRCPDISKNYERGKIEVENLFDSNPPAPFNYIVHSKIRDSDEEDVKRILIEYSKSVRSKACICEDSCIETKQCLCSTSYKIDDDGTVRVIDSKLNNSSIKIIECNSKCNCYECDNRLVQSLNGKMNIETSVFKTKNVGFSLKTKYAIQKGTYVGPYTGMYVLYDENNKEDSEMDDTYFYETFQDLNETIKKATKNKKRLFVDSREYGNASRFINHSCEPNLKTFHIFGDSMVPIIGLFTIKNINAGEELSVDYTKEYWDAMNNRGIYCRCDATNCRFSFENSKEGINKRFKEAARKAEMKYSKEIKEYKNTAYRQAFSRQKYR